MQPFPNLVNAEIERAARLHPPLANHDESMSVLDEEVCEVQKEVHAKPDRTTGERLLEELVQVAAMARRWAETTGMSVLLDRPFERAVELALHMAQKEVPKANSDHESLTRLKRVMSRVRGYSDAHGPSLAACQHDMVVALVAVATTCRRWAEDRGLCPTTCFTDDLPQSRGRVTVESSAPYTPPPEPDHATKDAEST